MSTKHKIWIALAILVFSAATVLAAEDEVTFRFDPPDGLTYYVSHDDRTIVEAGTMEKRTDVWKGRTRWDVEQTEEGFRLTERIVSASIILNGEELDPAVVSALTRGSSTWVVGSDGRLIDVEELDESAKILMEMVPSAFQEESNDDDGDSGKRIEELKEKWNSGLAFFAEKTVSVGEVFAGTEANLFSDMGDVAFYRVTKIAETMKCGDRDCVRLTFFYSTEADEVRSLIEKSVGDSGSLPSIAEIQRSDVSVTGHGETIVEPSTMLLQSESRRLVATVKSYVPGLGEIVKTVTEDEKSNYEYKDRTSQGNN